MNGLSPEYLQRLFAQSYSNYNLRNSEGKLALPKPRTNYLKRSFSFCGATTISLKMSDLLIYSSEI